MKLIAAFICSTSVVLLAVGITALIISYSTISTMTSSELEDLSKNIFSSAQIVFLTSEDSLSHTLDTAGLFVKDNSRLDEKNYLNVTITNQVTREETRMRIPEMIINGKVVLKSGDIAHQITEATGYSSTIFQLLPEGLLRISTTVRNADNSMDLWTLIPNDSPVYHQVVNGQPYIGTTVVADQLYGAAYKPIMDANSQIIGAVFVGKKLSLMSDIIYFKQQFSTLRVGKSGYTFIMDSKGNLIMHPSLEGKNVYDATDSSGRYYIREICSNKHGTLVYPLKEAGENRSRNIIVVYKYLAEWDWIIAVGAYIDELYSPIYTLQGILITVGLTLLIASIFLAYFISNSITKPVGIMSEELYNSSNSLETAANQVSSFSQEL